MQQELRKNPNKKVLFRDWGTLGYQEAWDRQEGLLNEIVGRKTANRDLSAPLQTPNYLAFVEHPHVYTIGKSGKEEHLLLDESGLAENNAAFYRINRGGDITYHGPGQLVGYPVLDLDNFFTDIHLYLRTLEEAVIRTLGDYEIIGMRSAGLTGVWLEAESVRARKICAMGVRCSRWVTMHGFALNVNTDNSFFANIVPCGISDKGVTSMEQELGRKIDMKGVKENLLRHISVLFDMEIIL